MTREFTLTENHIKMLRGLKIEWDSTEQGGIYTDCKRPYGSSDVADDVATILGIPVACDELGDPVYEDEDGSGALSPEQDDMCLELHQQIGDALQVVLSTGCFLPGDYVASDYDNDWRQLDVTSRAKVEGVTK